MKTASWRCRRGTSFAEKFPTRYRWPFDASFSTLENDRVRLSFTRSTRGAAFRIAEPSLRRNRCMRFRRTETACPSLQKTKAEQPAFHAVDSRTRRFSRHGFQPHRNRRLDGSVSAGRAVKHAETIRPLNSLTACNADTADMNSYGNPSSRHCGARDGDFASPARTNRPARIPISENIPPAVFSASPLLRHDDRRAALSPLLFASRMAVRKLYAAFDCFWCRMCYNVGNRTRVLAWRKPTWTLWKS